MARRTAGRALLVVLVASVLAVGCRPRDRDDGTVVPTGSPDDDTSIAEDGADATAAETDPQLITSSFVSTTAGSLSLASADLAGGDAQSSALGDGTKAIYFPRGCLEVVNELSIQTVTYKFNECLGPNGLRGVTGEVKVKHRAEAGLLHLDITATDLLVNRATVDLAGTADIRQEAGSPQRTMAWKAQVSGTTARGRAFSRASDHVMTWSLGESCFTLNGTAEGDIGERQIRTQAESFQRCRRACPDGRIIVTDMTRNLSFEVRYDGSNQATFVGPTGRERTFRLFCAAQ